MWFCSSVRRSCFMIRKASDAAHHMTASPFRCASAVTDNSSEIADSCDVRDASGWRHWANDCTVRAVRLKPPSQKGVHR